MGIADNFGRRGVRTALALCGALALGWALERLAPSPDGGPNLAPDWLPLAAAGVAVAGVLPLPGSNRWMRVRSALRWAGLLLLVWAANGLPFDLLTAAGLIGHRTADGDIVMSTVYWPGLVTRMLALAAAVVLARIALAGSTGPASAWTRSGYAYAAFACALPYPVLRAHWALGGTAGLAWPGAAGQGWEPLIIAFPWVLAALLSLLLVAPRSRIPRGWLLAAGWSATVIVASIGPAALWSLISAVAAGGDIGSDGIAGWVFALFYLSWFLWAIAGGAATLSYQVRTAAPRVSSGVTGPS